MIKPHFEMFARYNQWANARLFRMAVALPEEEYRRNVGAYFGSLHGTLNHLLTADRIWMRRLTGRGEHPEKLDTILYDERHALRTAREAQDLRILAFVQGLEESDFERQWDYRTLDGSSRRQPLGEILSHLFNHHTHHRGQSHAILTMLGVVEPEPLDLLIMLRERGGTS